MHSFVLKLHRYNLNFKNWFGDYVIDIDYHKTMSQLFLFFFQLVISWANYLGNDPNEIDLGFLHEQLSDPNEDDCFEKTKNVNQEIFDIEECNNTDFSVENYVIINFENNLFPGKVIEKKDSDCIVSVLQC